MPGAEESLGKPKGSMFPEWFVGFVLLPFELCLLALGMVVIMSRRRPW